MKKLPGVTFALKQSDATANQTTLPSLQALYMEERLSKGCVVWYTRYQIKFVWCDIIPYQRVCAMVHYAMMFGIQVL